MFEPLFRKALSAVTALSVSMSFVGAVRAHDGESHDKKNAKDIEAHREMDFGFDGFDTLNRQLQRDFEEFRFDETIKTMEDVKPGMTVPGIVTNITNFGVFVDIGVKHDGLIHISQLSNTFISDPNQVVKLQQQLMVTVTDVDITRKRISLTMKGQAVSENRAHQQRTSGISRQEPKKDIQKGRQAKQQEPANAFQAKLMELKKKFKD